jgi:sugar phosphate isomerase/epimerase
MINRRKFLQNTGALALGGLAISQPATGMSIIKNLADTKNVGVQLYTVTNAMDTDLDATLKRVAEIGYKDLETAFSRKGGFYGLKPKEFADKAKEYGLSWRAHHIGGAPFKMPAGAKPPVGADGKPIVFPPMKNLRDNYQEAVDLAAEGGVKYLVCASTPIDTLDETKQSIEVFNKTGEACKKAGIGFAFHNHTKEFDRIEGKVPYEMFLSEISADLMKFELDLGWATKSGTDPIELFKKHPGRFPLWHVKDLSPITQKPVEIGTGYVNLKRVFDAAESAGMQHFFVEQDAAPQPMDNIATSYKNLKAMIG